MDIKNPNVYFTYGRFQPPHVGHALLINLVKDLAKQNDADSIIFVSSTINKTKKDTKNPLPVDIKIRFLRKMFPKTQFIDGSVYGNNVIGFIKAMKERGYIDITGVFGGDRADEFKKLFGRYEPDVKIIKVDRDELESISATKMRNAALNDPEFFLKNTYNLTPDNAEELRKLVLNSSFGKDTEFVYLMGLLKIN